MSNYILKLSNKDKKIVNFDNLDYYLFSPRNSIVKSFIIYDKNKLNEILVKMYLKQYKSFMKMLVSINEEDGEEGYMLCLGELNKLRDTLEYKYKKYLKKVAYEKFIDDLLMYDKLLQDKICQLEENKEKAKGR